MDFAKLIFDSAISEDGEFVSNGNFRAWFEDRQNSHRFVIEPIRFDEMVKWSLDSTSGRILHESGRFFSIDGLKGSAFGSLGEFVFEQPIINQPEVGYLGFISKVFNGTLYFLVQAKMEPGNINMIQISPTLQATRSNFTRVHKGRAPYYLDYFNGKIKSKVIFDSLESEQGARFFRKRNRNIVVLVGEGVEVPVYDDYCWLTLGQIHSLIKTDNIVNMDARSVIACLPFLCEKADGGYASKVSKSLMSHESCAVYSDMELLSWFAEQKFGNQVSVVSKRLDELDKWIVGDREIYHEEGKCFSVGACRVEATSREVFSWTQPVVKPCEHGLFCFITKTIGDVLHVLVQAKTEPGIQDIVEIGPTVHCNMGGWSEDREVAGIPFLSYVLSAPSSAIRFDALQSEEGGRFFREENRNLIIEVGDDFSDEVPSNYVWMTLAQLKRFVRYNNFVNVEARSLISCMGLYEGFYNEA
ncbi:MAG: NDP-hexose 2,3-dehydratase family protein [Phycisphaerae bacterium]